MTWKEAIIRATRDVLAVIGFAYLSRTLVEAFFGEVPFLALTAAQTAVIAVAWRWANGRWFWQHANRVREEAR